MLKYRFFPYIIGTCIVVIVAVSFIGTRPYQRHAETDAADAQTPNRSVKERGTLLPHEREMRHERPHDHSHRHGEDAQYKSLESRPYIDVNPSEDEESEELKKKEELEKFQELREWVQTGKLTPYVTQELKWRTEWRRENDIILDVIQSVVTPDGTLHQVVVPKFQQYEEGDAILKSELIDEEYLKRYYGSGKEKEMAKGDAVTVNDVTYPMPDEYYDIENPYEREEYANKFGASLELGISMDEIEQKIASGELDMSLSESQKRMVDEIEAMNERARLSYQIHTLTLPKMPPLSDKPPVKVSFLPDEGEAAKRGWARKAQRKQDRLGDVAQPQLSEYESGMDDTRRSNHRSVSPELPSELPKQQRVIPSKQAMQDSLTSSPESLETLIKAQISPEERMKAIFSEKLSPEHDAPDEKLRRLREADSEGAKQRERHNNHADDPPPAR